MSVHQLAEIYHVLGFRGIRIPRSYVESIVRAIIRDLVLIIDVLHLNHNSVDDLDTAMIILVLLI